jgi:hypothetical protein
MHVSLKNRGLPAVYMTKTTSVPSKRQSPRSARSALILLRKLFGSWAAAGRLLGINSGILSAVARGKRRTTPQVRRALKLYTVWRLVNADRIDAIEEWANRD